MPAGEIALVRCCVVGGGPAGMMLGFLLARVGVEVVVLEKHRDFLRDFRGDTIHPSTLEVIHELGLLDDFLARTSFFCETQTVDFARVSRRSGVRYWVRSGLIPSRAKALVWSGVGRA